MFVIDAKKERIGVSEANKLGIPIVAICDTNSDPDLISVPIAGNDDAIRSVELITRAISDSIGEARREAPVRPQEEEGEESTYSSDRGMGILYTGGLLSFGYALREHPYAVGNRAGTALVAFPLVLTWASDIGAFFVGRAVGGPKLIPSVSPGKTISGALGGLAATVLVSWLYTRFALAPVALLTMTIPATILFGALISVSAQVGDLAESLLKREANVKDSSHLIPGHGGLLDRLDSLLFVLPVAYLLFGWLLLPSVP